MSRPNDVTGVLLINVGTPDAPRTPEVRRYLREFLSDPEVLDIHALARWLLLRLVILPFRPRASAEAYRKIWLPEGSPLLLHTRALADRLGSELGGGYAVAAGMRYGNPSIAEAIDALERAGSRRVILFPLYPQFATSTTRSALTLAHRVAGRVWSPENVAEIAPFYSDSGFVDAFARIGETLVRGTAADHVLFSFHGLPERHLRRADPSGAHCLATDDCCSTLTEVNRACYRAQCFETARRIASRLALEPDGWSVSFQSRLGRTPWIRPYTDDRLAELASGGIRRLAVFCPAFVADCLETLEEIAIRGRERFLDCGGEDLHLVPSLNAHPLWVDAAATMIRGAARGKTRPQVQG